MLPPFLNLSNSIYPFNFHCLPNAVLISPSSNDSGRFDADEQRRLARDETASQWQFRAPLPYLKTTLRLSCSLARVKLRAR